MRINFGEEDYSRFENVGSVSVTVAKLEDNMERIVVNITLLTFGQFANSPDLVLPAELRPLVEGVDPAECELCFSEPPVRLELANLH